MFRSEVTERSIEERGAGSKQLGIRSNEVVENGKNGRAWKEQIDEKNSASKTKSIVMYFKEKTKFIWNIRQNGLEVE